MSLRNIVVTSAVSILLAPSAILAQASNFEIHVGGKPVGKASYTLSPAKGGYKLSSRYSYRLGATSGDFSEEFKFDPNYAYVDGTVSDGNSQRKTSFLPNKTRTELSISSFLSGAEPTTFTTIKPDLMILPSFDPGAAQAILLLATTHPTADNKYDVFLPGGGAPAGGGGRRGGGPPPVDAAPADDAMPPGNAAYEAIWVKGRDLTGTLDAKPVTVHTYLLGLGKARWIFFADDADHLLQLNATALHASYIRSGFKLDPIAPAAVTPAAPASPPPSR